MYRVAFIINKGNLGWNGALNYYRNLLNAIYELPSAKILPVIVTGRREDKKLLSGFPDTEVVRTSIFDRFSPLWFIQRSFDHAVSRDILLERVLHKNKIDLLSHSAYVLNPSSQIPVCPWIPDFQPIHLPEFFSKREIANREKVFYKLSRPATRIILSSNDAHKDLASIAPELAYKVRVLQFVCRPVAGAGDSSLMDLNRKYDFSGLYFILPNQLWAHKNHKVVIDAVRVLKSRGKNALVLSTGRKHDTRNPNFSEELMRYIAASGVGENFRLLGEIPYSDLNGLIHNSVSLINPSFFEGWSSTVEEAKSLGKHVILSDIPVHREQNPLDAIYFAPHDPESLADIMLNRLSAYNPDSESVRRGLAEKEFLTRWRGFGQKYSDIVTEVLAHKR